MRKTRFTLAEVKGIFPLQGRGLGRGGVLKTSKQCVSPSLKFVSSLSFANKFFSLPGRDKRAAFTLAEVLITLSIIGVVAAMTMPTLIHKYQDMVLTNRFKKGYSQLSQAWRQAVAAEPDTYTGKGGWTCTWEDGTRGNFDVADGRGEALIKQFKNIKKCPVDKSCWADSFENYGDIFGWFGAHIKDNVWVTPDGMCISLSGLSVEEADQAHVALDTNCKQKPNKLGDDIFSMLLGADGIIYFATDSTSPNDNPIKNGKVCPLINGAFTINGRSVNFRDRLLK